MKKSVFIAILVAIFSTFSPAAAEEKREINMLFLGNSFTFRHNLNRLVQKVIEEGQPGLTVHTERVVYGGKSLFQHWTYFHSQTFLEQKTMEDRTLADRIEKMEGFLALQFPPDEFVSFWEDIRRRPVPEFPTGNVQKAIRDHQALRENNPRTQWDYVVLQSWQDVGPELDAGYAKYASKFAEIARRQGTQVVLYLTAPEIQNAVPVSGPLEQDRVDREIQLALRLANEIDAAAVIPVPLAINRIQQGGTDLTFCYVNDFHPNQYTAFLTANMFYAALFQASPEGFEFNRVTETNPKGKGEGKDPDGNDATVVFANGTKRYLQSMAHEAVVAFDALRRKSESPK